MHILYDTMYLRYTLLCVCLLFVFYTTTFAKSLLADRRYCGYQHADDYVRNNNNTSIDEFPWMAQLFQPGNKFRCVGSLISNRYVLTAAHCLEMRDYKLIIVRLGDYNIKTEIDCVYEQEDLVECSDPLKLFGIDEVVVHPFANSRTGENDIALIRLTETVTFSDFIRPICLPKRNSPQLEVGEMFTISGWNCLFSPKYRDGYKKRILASLLSDAECVKHYSNTYISNIFNGSVHLCIDEVDSFTCVGDSGSPLMYSVKVQWEQVGVLTFAIKKEDSKFPTVFTRVSNHLDWIEANLHP